ncbi:uncharacterized protein VTP21DRAFT_6887 [Calcarisporiella thermophila]|uniref:uncharacterized protein n=1 Tax=Calcarisporiella thermophila TaxID=911321 RepID=UPI0037442E0E
MNKSNFVNAQVFGQNTTVCLDQGSEISLMDHNLLKALNPTAQLDPPPNITVRGLGPPTKPIGEIEVELLFTPASGPKFRTVIKFAVLDNLPAGILIGNDDLIPRKMETSNAQRYFYFLDYPNYEIGFVKHKQANPPTPTSPTAAPPSSTRATAARDTTIKPGHRTIVPVNFVERISTEDALMTPVDLRGGETLVRAAHTVVKTDAPTPCIEVINAQDSPITLRKGETLATVTPLTITAQLSTYSTCTLDADQERCAFEQILAEANLNPELTDEQKEKVVNLLWENRHAFAYNNRVGFTDVVSMRIDTRNAEPISLPPYRASPRERKAIEDQIIELESQGIIRDSHSPWAAPVVLVRKKDGGLRFCVDYRKLNSVTVTDSYPIPRVDDLLTHLSGKSWFSTFDANKGFHQVPLATADDREKTAFRTHQGLKEFTRMPFGVKNGPAVFQRLMDRLLGQCKWDFAIVYIDDLIVSSKTFEEHLQHCETVLRIIIRAGLTLSLKKSYLFYQQITALGYAVSNLGLATQPEKTRAVRDWPTPESAKDVRQFLGLATYYRRFVKDFATIARPLTRLLKKDNLFSWTDEHQSAFETLKEKLTSAPILAQPDYSKPFVVYTDASAIGLGVVLAEQNYSATERECLAVIWALRKLHPYLDGSQFELITDHSALQWLFDFKTPNPRLNRWSMEIQPYREFMKIKHKPGKKHSNVDPLSRYPLKQVNFISTVNTSPELLSDFIQGYQHDPYFDEIARLLKTPPNSLNTFDKAKISRFELRGDLIYFHDASDGSFRLCAPNHNNLRLKLLQETHDIPISGHPGYDKTYLQLRKNYYWPRLSRDAKRYVSSCELCQRNKATNKQPAGLLLPLPVPHDRWEQISMDFIVGLPKAKSGYDSIIVFVDRLSKRAHFVPTKGTVTAPEVARLFFNNIFRLHGLPRVIITDRDSKFTSSFWQELFKCLGTKLTMSTAFHPQTDGQTERINRSLEEMLRHYVSYRQDNWDEFLTPIEFAYNNAIHTTTGFSPFFLDLGRDPIIPANLQQTSQSPTNVQAVEEFISALSANICAAQDSIQLAQSRQEKNYNKRRRRQTFDAGSLVMLSTANISIPNSRNRPSRKLLPKYIGPYKITEKLSDNAYRLDLPPTIGIHPVINVSSLKPYIETPADLENQDISRPPPIYDDTNSPVYEVEEIQDKRTYRGQIQYLVKWLGYPQYEATWEPLENLTGAAGAIATYEAQAAGSALPMGRE